jgi:hypothetical protein
LELGRKLIEKFNFPKRDADLVGSFLRRVGIVVQPSDLPPDLCGDATDVPVLGTAVACECALLISVDRELLDMHTIRAIPIIRPGEYWRGVSSEYWYPHRRMTMSESIASHRALWAGRIMSALVVIALLADGTIQLFAPAQMASMSQETGFAMDLTRIVGAIALACAILYAIPATAVLGAILVTGFLGGAICAHVRIGELGSPPEIISLLLGAMTWGGLYARDPRIRATLPLVR